LTTSQRTNWDERLAALGSAPTTQQMLTHLQTNFEAVLDEIITICEIPAPSFDERERAEYIARRMQDLGLSDVTIDPVNNVIGRYPGAVSKARLAVCAHIDTVFPRTVEISVQRGPDRLAAPGIGDNAASVGAMLHLAAAWRAADYQPPFDVLFVGNSCEEGLGDLKGIKGFLDEYAPREDVDLAAIICLDGHLGEITNAGIGSRRLKVTARAKGGHSWADFGSPSAVHALGACIEGIARLPVPKEPRTTYNVGVVAGGTSVNTIAEEAWMLIDMRSVAPEPLRQLEAQVREIIAARCREFGAVPEIEVVGDRPVGRIPDSHPLVQLAQAAGRRLGLELPTRAASTDANVPLSRNIPAITVGLYAGEGAHRESEFIVPSSLRVGLPLGLLILLAAVDWLVAA